MSILLIVSASFFWGFGFVATIWGLVDFDVMTLTFLRLGIAAVIMLPLAWRFLAWRDARVAIIAGLCLGAGLLLQTVGLKETTATKSGFLTTLYVLIVPLIERVWVGRKIRANVIWAAAFAFFGTALLSSPGLEPISRGDWFTIACAVVFAFQIAAVTQAQPRIRSVWGFSFWQTAIATLTTLPFVSVWPERPVSAPAWWGLAWIAVLSSVLAFSFQVRAQKTLSASVAATLCLLEGPFAALFGWWLLGDSMSGIQWVGAGIVVGAAVLATRE